MKKNYVNDFNTFVNENYNQITPEYTIGDEVMINPSNDNDNYINYRDKILIITNVSTNTEDHPGFDDIGYALYDLETVDGEEVPFSLYDYELIRA